MNWTQFFYLIGAALVGVMLYRYIRRDSAAFSSANLNKSLYTLGLLALALIAFIGICIVLLRQQ